MPPGWCRPWALTRAPVRTPTHPCCLAASSCVCTFLKMPRKGGRVRQVRPLAARSSPAQTRRRACPPICPLLPAPGPPKARPCCLALCLPRDLALPDTTMGRSVGNGQQTAAWAGECSPPPPVFAPPPPPPPPSLVFLSCLCPLRMLYVWAPFSLLPPVSWAPHPSSSPQTPQGPPWAQSGGKTLFAPGGVFAPSLRPPGTRWPECAVRLTWSLSPLPSPHAGALLTRGEAKTQVSVGWAGMDVGRAGRAG